MPQPSSMMELDGDDVRIVLRSMFEGEESHSAKRGVIFHRTVCWDCLLVIVEFHETKLLHKRSVRLSCTHRNIPMYA